ncbi:MAG: hypothetical protein HKN17_02205, partial [Rhodothermales bacterium]|nr:hypothetical protein [Rhodothermales bacterium]
LTARLPGVRVEMINLGMTAVNSYTIRDLTRHVRRMEPDAVVIYAGHNEYYGALGVGSTPSIAPKGVWFGRLQLLLKRSALYLAIERVLLGPPDYGLGPKSNARTLMSRVVRDAGITYDGERYAAGLRQFENNMDAVLEEFEDADIPVFAGTLVANLSGQAPLSDNPDAMAAFERGRELLSAGDVDAARSAFRDAMNLDAIRFRAPTAVNERIRSWSERDGVSVVDLEPVFRAASDEGIPGYDLFTDHLHPTLEGYDLMAGAFFENMEAHPVVSGLADDDRITIPWDERAGSDAFSLASADILIERLLSDYPFRKNVAEDSTTVEYARELAVRKSSGRLGDSLAAVVMTSPMSIQAALNEGARLSLARGDSLAAMRYYASLFHWQPFNAQLMQNAVAAGLASAARDSVVERLALFGANRTGDAFFWNALAVTQLRQGRLESAGAALKRAALIDPDSPVMLYNRARMHLAAGDSAAARRDLDRFRAAQRRAGQ